MPAYRDVLPADSSFHEACARHTARTTTRSLQHIYLCDACAIRLVREAFNDRPPLYHGETIEGYCGLCNTLGQVTLRQWFVCPVCWNVVVAYQKSFVAALAVPAFWHRDMAGHFPAFELSGTDEVRVTPFARGASTKREAARVLKVLDYLVSERVGDEKIGRFHIELKSGPGSIEQMKEFQLDVNDFNDIAGAINNTGVPAYIFHLKLDQEHRAPTRRTIAAGMWWTDPETLRANLKNIKKRRGEDKPAAYFRPSAFRPWSVFEKELASRRFEELARAGQVQFIG